MRLLKAVSVCVAGCALLAEPCLGQQSGSFDNSWFWGVKGGVNSFSIPGAIHKSAPTWGLDWMITRTHGGLYVSADQSFFTRTVTSADSSSTSGKRQVLINDLRRVGFGGLVFPPPYGRLRAYAGLGAAISIIGSAIAQNDSSGGAPSQQFIDRTDKARSRASILAMAGTQLQVGRTAFFMQETWLPSGSEFLVPSTMSFFELGLRYNLGSSKESAH